MPPVVRRRLPQRRWHSVHLPLLPQLLLLTPHLIRVTRIVQASDIFPLSPQNQILPALVSAARFFFIRRQSVEGLDDLFRPVAFL